MLSPERILTHGDFTQRFYSDEAVLYFYGNAREIEKALFDTMDFPPEKYPLEVRQSLRIWDEDS